MEVESQASGATVTQHNIVLGWVIQPSLSLPVCVWALLAVLHIIVNVVKQSTASDITTFIYIARHASINCIIRRALAIVGVPAFLDPMAMPRDDRIRSDGVTIMPFFGEAGKIIK